MAKVHNIYEYAFAKQVVKEVPDLIKDLKVSRQKFESFRHYQDVSYVVCAIDEAIAMLLMQLEVYKEVVKTKGKQ